MLKKIPFIISPDLMKVLMEMGHGDEICFSDGNFPSESTGKRVVRMDGHGIEEMLKAILVFFPLDMSDDKSVFLMQKSETEPVPQIWARYRNIIQSSEEKAAFDDFGMIKRFEFYERARRCYAVVATGESALYANIVLKKGVVIL